MLTFIILPPIEYNSLYPNSIIKKFLLLLYYPIINLIGENPFEITEKHSKHYLATSEMSIDIGRLIQKSEKGIGEIRRRFSSGFISSRLCPQRIERGRDL